MSGVTEVLRGHPRHVIAGAVAIGLALSWRSPLLLAALLIAAVALAGLAQLRVRLLFALLAALIAGGLVADARLTALDRSDLSGLIGHAVRAEVTFTQSPRLNSFGWSALGRLRGEPVLIRSNGSPPTVAIGAIVNAAGSLRPLAEDDRWLAVQHVRAILKLRSIEFTRRERGGLAGVVDAIRARATVALSTNLPPAEAGLLRGMTLGDDSAIVVFRTSLR